MDLTVNVVGEKIVQGHEGLSGEQIAAVERGITVYRKAFLGSPRASNIASPESVVIPNQPRAMSVAALSSADVLSGQRFDLGDLLCPFVSTEREPALYEYQKVGSAWLTKTRAAILADDMGLGKTVQAISALSTLIKSGQAHFGLVICTKSLVLNWVSELNFWTPWLAVTPLIASSAGGREIWKQQCRRAHVVVTTYDQLRIYSELFEEQCGVVIIDEAHRLKNINSTRSHAFRNMTREFTWMLTGTPIERDQQDLLNLMTILKPSLFTSRQSNMDPTTLRALTKPFILRRRKEEVLSELPEMIDIVEKIPLSVGQRHKYRTLLMRQPNNYLSRFSRLRELCDIDPETRESSKLDRIEELLSNIKKNNEKAVIFSYWVHPLEILYQRLAGKKDLKIKLVSATENIVSRNLAIQDFKISGDCLLISGHIGAEGLNLTEANHVIFINRWWNPSAILQAKDRVRRIGQKKISFSYSFVAPDTLEEDISRLIVKKQLTFNELVEGVRGSLYRPR